MCSIRAYREKARLTQVQLAELCGWSQSRLNNYETGRRTPGIAELKAIKAALAVSKVKVTLDQLAA